MVKYLTSAIVVDNTSIFFGPDATCEGNILLVVEAAGNHYTGTGQRTESERNVGSQSVELWGETNRNQST